jgi:cation diffusion facilitator CzcD-associated flavoprotein CzcO
MCSGYYRYDAGYTPELPGAARFQGAMVHPQRWTDDVLYAGRRVVVLGSGATAVTLVPNLAQQAAHVTMLQRSPTYILSAPSADGLANLLQRFLPPSWAHRLTRWRNIVFGMVFFQLARRLPHFTRRYLLRGVRDALGPAYDVDTHFAPRYDPWDQRLCLVPDGDLFEAIKAGRASVVTDEIETLTESGIQLRSGATLQADLIVTATGLNLQVMGGVSLSVDGRAVKLADTFAYKGMMFSDVPNLALALGYTNASWTLKCDLTCGYVCRLLNHMAKHGYDRCAPRNRDPALGAEPWTNLTSGYVQRAIAQFPKQGSKAPWRLHQNYARDLLALRFGRLEDGVMEFSRSAASVARAEADAALSPNQERA